MNGLLLLNLVFSILNTIMLVDMFDFYFVKRKEYIDCFKKGK